MIARLRWLINVSRVASWYFRLPFSHRQRFLAELRPYSTGGDRIAYPDAFFFITIRDICRAIEFSE